MLAFLRIYKPRNSFSFFFSPISWTLKYRGTRLSGTWMNTFEMQASFLYILWLKFFLMCVNVCIDMFHAFGVTYVWEHVSVQGCADVRNYQQLSHLLHWVRVPESNPEFTDRPSLVIVCCGNFLSLPSEAGIPGGMLHSFVIYVCSRIQTLILMFVQEILYLSSWFSKSTVDWSLFFRYMNLLREKYSCLL